MTDIELAEDELLRNGLVAFNKDIAGSYVKPLLGENILRVTKDHIQVRNLVVSRERVVFLHIALTQLRSPSTLFPIHQGINGFTVEKVQAARGNDIVDAYRITSNASDHTSILLTKKLAWELWEVVAFFIPGWEAPLDNPLPKTTYFGEREDRSPRAENPEPENFSDDDEGFEDDEEFDDEDEEDGPVTFDYTPFEPAMMDDDSLVHLIAVVVNGQGRMSVWNREAQTVVVFNKDGDDFVIVSSNESEHAEWEEGSEWGEYLTNILIPALHEFSVETYNDEEEFLDDDFVADVEYDTEDAVE